MPALLRTEHTCTILWLGCVPDRQDSLRAGPIDEMPLTFQGFAGEDHSGLTRPSCSRVKALYPVGSTIRNTRQMTIVSANDLSAIAAAMGLGRIDPAWLGASVVVDGIPDFSFIPASSRLAAPDGPALTIDMQNRPCSWPAKEIENEAPGKGALFKAAAKGRRGVTAWVEREGVLRLGQTLALFVPSQRAWQP